MTSALVWFRRDLRCDDHAALARALREAQRVHCAFVFDRAILDVLPSRRDRRVEFIHGSVLALDAALRRRGGGLVVRHADARDEIPRLARALGVRAVYANADYEPSARARDARVADELAATGIAFVATKDHVVFERDEVVSAAGAPYSVFTPYRRAWLAALAPAHLAPHVVSGDGRLAAPPPTERVPTLHEIGFGRAGLADLGVVPGMDGAAATFDDFAARIDRYRERRDFPAQDGPSNLSVHLRFGTISVRRAAAFAHERSLRPGGEGASAWLSELIWREFFAQLLWHHPHVVSRAFRPEYANLAFPGGRDRLDAWREGRTGYPIVDAGLRQLAQTGCMHNRLRMIAASFLVKDLLVDWREGERHFAQHLLDFDLASNNGNWQWCAGTGSDAQPWFRIFNPVTQSRRFDREGAFIRRLVPEVAALDDDAIHAPWTLAPDVQRAKGVVIGRDYARPIVDHAAARAQALDFFGQIRKTPAMGDRK